MAFYILLIVMLLTVVTGVTMCILIQHFTDVGIDE